MTVPDDTDPPRAPFKCEQDEIAEELKGFDSFVDAMNQAGPSAENEFTPVLDLTRLNYPSFPAGASSPCMSYKHPVCLKREPTRYLRLSTG